MRIRKFIAALSFGAIGAAPFAAPAVAQQGVIDLSTIVVSTSRKWEENAQRVPGSVDISSGEELERALADDIEDAIQFSPNAHIKQTNAESLIVIRGIGSYDTAIYGPVGVFVNDVALPVNFMHNLNLLDVEQMEILKGPQGTIYGRNTEAGAIKITTRRPDDKPSAEAFFEASFFDADHGDKPGFKTGGRVSSPLVEGKAALSFSGQVLSSEGYVVNRTFNDDNAAEIQKVDTHTNLVITPNSAIDISLSHTFHRGDNGKDYFRFQTGAAATPRHEVTHDQVSTQNDETHVGGLTATYDAGPFEVTSITGLTTFDRDFVLDFNSTPFPGITQFDLSDDTVSQEIRVTGGKEKDPFRWLIGAYGFREDLDVLFNLAAIGVSRDTSVDTEGIAFFGQVTVSPVSRLRITGGLRYEHLDLEGEMDFATPFFAANFAQDLSYDTWLPKASIAVDVTDQTMIYASASRGYLAGGYNYSFANSLASLTYDPEFTWNYEVGAKANLLQGKLTVDASLFYIDAKDKQVTELLPGGAQRISNAPESHSQGGEIAATFKPNERLALFGGVGVTETRVDEFIGTVASGGMLVPFDFKGRKLPNAPEYTYNLGAQYTTANGWFGRVDILGTGAFFFDPANTLEQDSYVVTNAQIGRKWKDVEVTLWSKNLFDEAYLTSAVNFFGSVLVEDAAPRSFGVKAKAKW